VLASVWQAYGKRIASVWQMRPPGQDIRTVCRDTRRIAGALDPGLRSRLVWAIASAAPPARAAQPAVDRGEAEADPRHAGQMSRQKHLAEEERPEQDGTDRDEESQQQIGRAAVARTWRSFTQASADDGFEGQ
jgi:hypothetical protein